MKMAEKYERIRNLREDSDLTPAEDNSTTGKLIRSIFFAFAEFEQDMIVERTSEGKAVARERDDYR